mgnify:CR=1 FL=1
MPSHFNSGFTAVPNIILDSCSRLLSPNEFLILMLIVRKTVGWHKSIDTISLTQFMKCTNLSRNTCIKAIKKLTNDGFITALSVNHLGTIYRLEPIERIHEIVESKLRKSQLDEQKAHDSYDSKFDLVNDVDHSSSIFGPLQVQDVNTHKEIQINNEKNIKNSLLDCLTIPANVSADKLSQFIDMRKSQNNPLSLFGAQNLLEKLISYGGDANEALSNAIIGNHDNVIPVKKISNISKPDKNSTLKSSLPRRFN